MSKKCVQGIYAARPIDASRWTMLDFARFGEVTERPKVQHWKCCVGETLPRVRISPSPLCRERIEQLRNELRLANSCLSRSRVAESPCNDARGRPAAVVPLRFPGQHFLSDIFLSTFRWHATRSLRQKEGGQKDR